MKHGRVGHLIVVNKGLKQKRKKGEGTIINDIGK